MASPSIDSRYDATYDWAGTRVRTLVISTYDPVETTILDVGAGWGKYRDLLPEYRCMDACEIWKPYIEGEDLHSRYRHVFDVDIVDLVALDTWHPGRYDLVIMGDVLEHLTRPRAQFVVSRLGAALVVVPFLYPQNEVDGNPHEVHWQSDLTPSKMELLYPELELLDIENRGNRPFKGLYQKKGR
jgi:hypothetical protein